MGDDNRNEFEQIFNKFLTTMLVIIAVLVIVFIISTGVIEKITVPSVFQRIGPVIAFIAICVGIFGFMYLIYWGASALIKLPKFTRGNGQGYNSFGRGIVRNAMVGSLLVVGIIVIIITFIPLEEQPDRSSSAWYVRQIENQSSLIVFVHGLAGDGSSTWTASNGAYFPALIAHDPYFGDFDVLVFQYPTEILGE